MEPIEEHGLGSLVRPRRLKFADRSLEARYRLHRGAEARPLTIASLAFGVLTYGVFFVLDALLVPTLDDAILAAQIRVPWLLLALGATIVAVRRPRWFERHHDEVIFVLATIACLSLILMIGVLPGLGIYFAGVMVVQFFITLPMRLGYGWAALMCLISLAGFAIVAFNQDHRDPNTYLAGAVFLALNVMIVPALAWMNEIQLRRGFIQRLQIEALAARHRENAELHRELAERDPLTGAYNRRRFDDLARREMERFRRHGARFALLALDLDHFKRVNDTYGHGVGDATLQQLSDLCRTTLRSTDTFARLGGEEFAILLPDASLGSAVATAERLRHLVERLEIPIPSGVLRITASIGVAVCGSGDTGVDSVLDRADAALYEAKVNGRNRICARERGSVHAGDEPLLPLTA